MKRLEALCIAGALTVGSIVGWAGARTVRADPARIDESARPAGSGAVASAADGGDDAERFGTISSRLASISEDPLPSRRRVALSRFCAGLDAEGVRHAAQALTLDDSPRSREQRISIMARWAELEPAAAAAFAVRTKSIHGTLQTVLDVWVAQDREAAKHFVAGLNHKELLNGVLYYFTVALATVDADEALKFADSVPTAAKHNVVWGVFRTTGHLNPTAAVARALTMPAGKVRESAIDAAISVWLEEAPAAAMAWVRQRPDTPVTFGSTLLESAVQRWSRSDPLAAGRFAQSLPAGRQRDDTTRYVASSWAYRDLDQARGWVHSLPEGKAKAGALAAIVGQWSSSDPPAAAAFVAGQPAGENTGEILEQIGRNWAATDPTGALAWAATQPDAVRKQFAPTALGTLAADDPAGAVAGLASLRTPDVRAEAITAIAKSWAVHDPQEAADWVLNLPAADASRAALREVISQGASRNPAAMAEWLEGMTGHPRRDLAVETFAKEAQYYDPLAAVAWAHTLTDAETRRPLVKTIVRNLANYDPAGAREWVNAQTFEPAEHKTLLDQIDQAMKRK